MKILSSFYNTDRVFNAFFFILIFSSCRVSHDSVCGIYKFVDKHNPEFSEFIHLKPDDSFNFVFTNSFIPYPRLQGSWQLKDNNIIVNSTNLSVLPDAIGGDTLKFTNWTYKVSHNRLKRRVNNGKLITLKKVHGHFKTFILNYQEF